MTDISVIIFGVIGALSLLLLVLVALWYRLYFKYFGGLHKVTGPKYWPLLGHALKLSPHPATMIYVMDQCVAHNGIARMMAGFTFALLVTDYKFTEFILSSNSVTKKTFNYHFLENWLGTGLLLSNGAKWKSRRRTITPAFHFQILNQYIDVFDSTSDILVSELQKEVDIGATNIELYEFVPNCALDAICETAMRTKINLQTQKHSSYTTAVKNLTGMAMFRLVNPFNHYDFFYKWTPMYREEQHNLRIVHGHADSVIKKHRNELKNNPDHNENVEEVYGKKKKVAFIDILMQGVIDGKPLSDEDVREEVETFMFAGHDTTSEAICFALYSIAQYPDIQKKVIEEQTNIFYDDRSRAVTPSDLQDMKYLELVIKETLRLYPSVPSIGREVTEDFEYDGMTFKKGLNINLFIYGMHRNPEYFPDPLTFNPERFNSENCLGKYPYSYVPFSAGPRNCIGQKFALMEMKMVISKVVRNFVLSKCQIPHKVEPIQKVTLFSYSGIPIQIKKRIW